MAASAAPAVLCYGDLLIDFVPLEGGLELGDVPAFARAAGGAAANVAVGLSRLGVRSAFMSKVGDDPFGRFLKRTLDENGVDTSALLLDPQAPTSLAFVSLRADGERDFLFYRDHSADMTFTPEEVKLDAIRDAAVFHHDSISMADPRPRETARFAAAKARAAGRLVSFDVNLREPLWKDLDDAKSCIREGIAGANVVKLSEEELHFLTGRVDADTLLSEFWHDGLKLAVITLGSRGTVVVRPDGVETVASVPVKAVDATGAGDAFVGGLLTRMLESPDGWDDADTVRDAVRFANAAGAATAMGRGAIASLPNRERVEALLKG